MVAAALATAGPVIAHLAGRLVHFKERGPSSVEYVPDRRFVKATSFGFDNAVSDLLWIEAIQYFREETLKPRRAGRRKGPLLKALADDITDLDPHFHGAYDLLSLFLRVLYRYDEAIDLLVKGMACNPKVFLYPYQLGVIHYYDLKDRPLTEHDLLARGFESYRDVGVHYFKQAMGCPGKPEFFIRFLEAIMTGRGELEAVLEMYVNEYEKTKGQEALREYWEKKIRRLLAIREVRALQQGMAKYKERTGSPPPPEYLPKLRPRGALRDLGAWHGLRAFRTSETSAGSLEPFSDVILFDPERLALLSVFIRKYVLGADCMPAPERDWDRELEALEKR
jgi:hypothetical protein